MTNRLLPFGLAVLLALAAPVARSELIQVPLPDGSGITAYWLPRPAGGVAPAVVALHGCGGLFDRAGTAFDPRYPEYVARLHRAGFHVLLPDSFSARGSKSICTVPNGERTVTVETRRDDAFAAVDWLAKRADVDARQIVMLGWSDGASTTLSALNAARPTYARTVAAAITFYPGCSAFLKSPFELGVPLLMLLGEKDDWTPPERCLELAERTRAAAPATEFEVHLYSDSHHGFDSTQPVRFRKDVPNGVTGKGVHSGGNPAARAAALAEVDNFLSTRLRPLQSTAPATPVEPAAH